MNNKLLFLILICLTSFSAVAKHSRKPASNIDSSKNLLNSCKISPKNINNFEPAEFSSSNNLLRPTGGNSLTCGQKMIIRGKLVDKNCVPISDAKIYIWQVACDGKYPYEPLRNVAKASALININSGSTFTGSGIATTNNKGEFYFITTMPKAVHSKRPHVNFRISHYLLGELETIAYVTSNPVEDDPEFERVIPYYQSETLVNEIKLVMPAKNELKSF